MISIHAPARGATNRSGEISPFKKISIHAPARGATINALVFSPIIYYFNPRSREGSDDRKLLEPDTTKISIHAPARGATAAA